jgi:hypothetical protein
MPSQYSRKLLWVLYARIYVTTRWSFDANLFFKISRFLPTYYLGVWLFIQWESVCMFNPLGLSLNNTMTILLGSSPTGTRTIALNTTFESFILLESVSHEVKWFLWWKCLDCLDWNGLFWCSECGHSRQMYNILSIGRASMFVMPCLVFYNVWWQGRIS